MVIKVKENIGPRCIIKEDGLKIYHTIIPLLRNGDTVILDFDGVTQFASPFFNFAIGQLLRDIKEDDLRKLLKFENLLQTGKMVVEKVIENAAKYYGDQGHSKIVDDILEQQAKESD